LKRQRTGIYFLREKLLTDLRKALLPAAFSLCELLPMPFEKTAPVFHKSTQDSAKAEKAKTKILKIG